MQSPNVVKHKPYDQPILRELTSEQAVLFLVGHAYIGNQGAKELMEMLFPLPMDSRIARTHETREMVGRPESKGEQPVERQEIEAEDRRGKRRHRRLELEAEVTVRSENGLVPGQSLDISESGMSVVLPVDLPVGETVELEINCRRPRQLPAPLCGIAMFFVMDLSSRNHCAKLLGTKQTC